MSSERRIRITRNRLSITRYRLIISQRMRAGRVTRGPSGAFRALPGAAELLYRQQRIHRSGTESFQIKSDELESQGFEDCGELGCDGRIQSPFQLLPGDLDPDNVTMMPYPELPETKATNRVLATLHHVKRLARYRTAVFDAGGEAGRCWLVPDAEPGLACQFANFLLAQARLQQRS